jgi:hypothetical protein
MFRRNDVVGANRHASRTVFWPPFNFLELRNAEVLWMMENSYEVK